MSEYYGKINYLRFTELDRMYHSAFQKTECQFEAFLGSVFAFLEKEMYFFDEFSYFRTEQRVETIMKLQMPDSHVHTQRNEVSARDRPTASRISPATYKTLDDIYHHAFCKTRGQDDRWTARWNFLETIFGYLRRETSFYSYGHHEEATKLVKTCLRNQHESHVQKRRRELVAEELVEEYRVADGAVPVCYCKLNKRPKTLKILVDLFLYECVKGFRVYLSEESFVASREQQPYATWPLHFRLKLRGYSSLVSEEMYLRVYGATEEAALRSLEYIVSLFDDWFERISLAILDPYDSFEVENVVSLCPLFGDHLRHMLSSANNRFREVKFERMQFSSYQGKILATSHTNGGLHFKNCEFADDGDSFAKHFVSSAEHLPIGEASRSFRFASHGIIHNTDEDEDDEEQDVQLPLSDRNWRMFLSKLPETAKLYISGFDLGSADLGTPGIEVLDISESSFNHGDCGLTEAILSNRGPRKLRLCNQDELPGFDEEEETNRFLLGSVDASLAFFRALGQNTRLQELDLSSIHTGELGAALIESLQTNQHLVHLRLDLEIDRPSDIDIVDILASMSHHPTLRTIEIITEGNNSISENEIAALSRVEAARNMLLFNQVIESFSMRCFSQGRRPVVHLPDECLQRMEVNRLRNKLKVVWQSSNDATRRALIANIMSHISSNPSLLWLMMNWNHGAVIQWIEENTASRRSIRKRPCSSSSH